LFVVDAGVVERSDSVIGRDEESDEYVEAETDARRATKRPLTRGWVFQLLPVILKREKCVEREDDTRWLCEADRHRYRKHKLSGHNSRAQAQTQGLRQAEERQGWVRITISSPRWTRQRRSSLRRRCGLLSSSDPL
jgi:hypothetical protein